MLPYLITIAVSTALLAFGDSLVGRSVQPIRVAMVLLALLLPCVLAGARDAGVGMDTMGYGKAVYSVAESSSQFTKYLDNVMATGYDIGICYSVMAYVVVRTTHSMLCYYFVIEFLQIVPYYLAMRIMGKGKKAWIGMLSYYLLFLILSMNDIRQLIAMSMAIYACTLVMARQPVRSLVVYFVAVGFHSTAIVFLVFPIAWNMMFTDWREGWRSRQYARAVLSFLVIAFAVVYANRILILDVLASVPFLDRYRHYLNVAEKNDGIAFYLFFGLMSIGLAGFIRKSVIADKRIAWFLFAASLISFPLYSLQYLSTQYIRMSWYAYAFPATLLYVKGRIVKRE